MEHQSPSLRQRELEGEIVGKPVGIARNRPVQLARADAIKARQIRIEEHALAPDNEDALLNRLTPHGAWSFGALMKKPRTAQPFSEFSNCGYAAPDAIPHLRFFDSLAAGSQ
ncbi:MAG: hypothetical protein Q7S40_21575 [Opitutaceae bacterium]|nr:hypothetical protein [Opitutaceae bacterium]